MQGQSNRGLKSTLSVPSLCLQTLPSAQTTQQSVQFPKHPFPWGLKLSFDISTNYFHSTAVEKLWGICDTLLIISPRRIYSRFIGHGQIELHFLNVNSAYLCNTLNWSGVTYLRVLWKTTSIQPYSTSYGSDIEWNLEEYN